MRKKTKFSPEVVDICVSLYNNGVNINDICKEYGCSKQSVYNWVSNAENSSLTTVSIPEDVAALKKELIETRQQLRESQEAIYILKKALTFFK